jgi:undecaprenyl-diphosphatase
LTVENSEPKSGPFAAMRRHYRETRPDHGPVPKALPLVIISVLGIAAFFLVDARAAGMVGTWPDWVRQPAAFLTDLGKSWWIITATVLIILGGIAVRSVSTQEERRRYAAQAIAMASYVLVSVSIAGLISNIFKRAIGRPRPELFGEHGLFSFNPFMHNSDYESFPSGHATTCGALWTALALLFPQFRWPLLVIGVYLAATRVFVGAHFPSDVFVGFGWGMWFAFFMAIVFARHGIVFSHRQGKLARLV